MASSPQLTVATAYRELYRAGLRAIQYSTPARYTLRSTIRRAFRNGAPADLDPTKVRRTVLFLQNAAKSRGTEHRVTRNLMIYRWYELEHGKLSQMHSAKMAPEAFTSVANAFEETLKMLNESMGLCLR